ncbi:MAG TPA: hypothetical protein VHY19_06405 [Steroidobacteraceae bacterium]|nr:hypothetical protein [Steroidobacteraceae bacterium]
MEGVVIAAFDQEFGSVGFLAMGVVVGLSGAVTHALAIQLYSFERLPYLIQVSILSIGAVLLPAAFLVTDAVREPAPYGHPFWELAVIGEAIIPMAVIASVALCWLNLRIGRPTGAEV